VLQPLALMLVLTFVFAYLFRMTEAVGPVVDLPIMILCGLVFWQYFATGLTQATRALLDNKNLVNKVAFPREVLPLAAVLNPLVNLAIGVGILLTLYVLRGGSMSVAWAWLLPVFAIQFVLVTGLGLLLAAGQVHFQDVGYMADVAILFGFYASPVFYPLAFVLENEQVPAWLQDLYMLNPMAGLLSAYRQILFESRMPDPGLLLWPAALALLMLFVGAIVFRRHAPTFSDRL